ncbi:MAG: GldG family protein [Chloroflexi bacterium]|nr:GldG family protein [Chloroflexota bacterium]
MSNETLSPSSFSWGRKWSIGLNVMISILALLEVAVMLNYLAARHYRRFYLSSQTRYQLSPLTMRVLNSLTHKVRVIVFFDRREPLYSSVSSLIKEYQLVCPKLEVEYVDYRYPGRAEAIRTQYALAATANENQIIFDANGRTKVVSSTQLSEYDYSELLSKREVKRTAFKGEQMFTSAIYSVTELKPPKAYFLQGHGEHDPANEISPQGYGKFAKVLKANNVEIESLTSLIDSKVPPDCQLLIIAGPIHTIPSEEVENIEKYLELGGRLFLLLNAYSRDRISGLEKTLANWNVEVGRNLIMDKDQAKSGGGQELLIDDFANHPIVNPLLRSRLLLVAPRSAGQRSAVSQSADAPKTVELAFTSREGQAVTNIDSSGHANLERTGTIPLLAAVEKGTIQGLSADRGATRLVVAGESLFLANLAIEEAANRDFANLAVNWLLNRELLLADIGPRPIKEYKITMTESQMTRVRWILLAGIPGAVLLLGLLVWFTRRI